MTGHRNLQEVLENVWTFLEIKALRNSAAKFILSARRPFFLKDLTAAVQRSVPTRSRPAVQSRLVIEGIWIPTFTKKKRKRKKMVVRRSRIVRSGKTFTASRVNQRTMFKVFRCPGCSLVSEIV